MTRLGLNPTVTPKLVDYSRCTRCGRCVLGCPTGAKWDSREHLRQAVSAGARVLTGSKVERLVLADPAAGAGGHATPGRATGVLVKRGMRTEFVARRPGRARGGRLRDAGHPRQVGLRTEDRLFVDPVLCVAAPADGCHMDEEVPMPFFVEGDGYIISPYFDYLSFFFNRSWKRPRRNIVSLMIKLADSEAGSVDGRGKVNKSLNATDKQRLAAATESCIEILARFGARRDSIFLGTLNAGHPGGTLPLTGRERESLHSDELPANVYVADASLLPRSLGRPPILTIMALARRVAGLCVERFA